MLTYASPTARHGLVVHRIGESVEIRVPRPTPRAVFDRRVRRMLLVMLSLYAWFFFERWLITQRVRLTPLDAAIVVGVCGIAALATVALWHAERRGVLFRVFADELHVWGVMPPTSVGEPQRFQHRVLRRPQVTSVRGSVPGMGLVIRCEGVELVELMRRYPAAAQDAVAAELRAALGLLGPKQ